MTFFDTKDRAGRARPAARRRDGSFNGNIVNVWQMPLEDAGLLGVDKGKGGKYPDPAARLRRTRCPTATSRCSPTRSAATCCSARTSRATASADVAKSIAYGKRMKVYPLAQAANPPATVFTDVKDVVFDSTIRYDASFFEHLDRIVQSEPWLRPRPRDDRSVEVARHREGQAVQARRCDEGAADGGDTRSRDLAGSEIRCRLAAVLFATSRWTVPGASGSRQGGAVEPMPIRTRIRSTPRAWPTAMPLSASSGWAPASST